MTSGEELFLMLWDWVASSIVLQGRHGAKLDYLLSERGFVTFSHLVVTSEIFRRCVRTATIQYTYESHSAAKSFGKTLRRELGVSGKLTDHAVFCETVKRVAAIVVGRRRSNVVEKAIMEEEPPYCFWCDIKFDKSPHASQTIEHIWPLSLGGETISENLLLACANCNSKRSDMFSWALGPVQSTCHVHTGSAQAETARPPYPVQFSLALMRLMAGASQRPTRSLKDAAKSLRPLIPKFTFEPDRPYLYFDIVEHIGEVL